MALPDIDSEEVPIELTDWQTFLTYLPPRRTVSSFLCSTLVHVLLLVVLTLIIVAPEKENGILSVEAGIDDSSPVTLEMDSTQSVQLQSIQSLSNFEVSTEVDIPLPQAPVVGVQASQPRSEQSTISTAADLKAFANLPVGGGMSGRAEDQRNELVVSEGGKVVKMARTHVLPSLSFMGMSFWKSCLVKPDSVSTAHVKMRDFGG